MNGHDTAIMMMCLDYAEKVNLKKYYSISSASPFSLDGGWLQVTISMEVVHQQVWSCGGGWSRAGWEGKWLLTAVGPQGSGQAETALFWLTLSRRGCTLQSQAQGSPSLSLLLWLCVILVAKIYQKSRFDTAIQLPNFVRFVSNTASNADPWSFW